MITRPLPGEYNPLADRYIQLVPEGNLIDILFNRYEYTMNLLRNRSEELGNYRYDLDKWSLKAVIGHISDVERLWSYRILRLARGDIRVLSGYDRDIFALNAPFDQMPLTEALKDYKAVRSATISLLTHLEEKVTLSCGNLDGHPITARAAAYIIAGHDIHHMNVVEEKYLRSRTE